MFEETKTIWFSKVHFNLLFLFLKPDSLKPFSVATVKLAGSLQKFVVQEASMTAKYTFSQINPEAGIIGAFMRYSNR